MDTGRGRPVGPKISGPVLITVLGNSHLARHIQQIRR